MFPESANRSLAAVGAIGIVLHIDSDLLATQCHVGVNHGSGFLAIGGPDIEYCRGVRSIALRLRSGEVAEVKKLLGLVVLQHDGQELDDGRRADRPTAIENPVFSDQLDECGRGTVGLISIV